MEKLFIEELVSLSKQVESTKIGNLSEKTLHWVVKKYLEFDEEYHEIKIGPYYADIFKDGKVFEVQTRHFNKLRFKLDYFLKDYDVEIVYPSFRKKYINWLDKDSLELKEKRLSPKRGNIYQIFPELYKIKFYLDNPRLKQRIVLFDVDEYKLLDGFGKDFKKRASKLNTIPLELVEEVEINCLDDYKKLIPKNLPLKFTTKDFSKASRLTIQKAGIAVNVLHHLMLIDRVGKDGRSYLYSIKN